MTCAPRAPMNMYEVRKPKGSVYPLESVVTIFLLGIAEVEFPVPGRRTHSSELYNNNNNIIGFCYFYPGLN